MPLDWPSPEGVNVPELAAGKRLAIIEDTTVAAKQGFAKLLHVDTAGLTEQPLRNAAALNRQVDDAWTEGTIKGFHTRLVRCVAFQTGVADYQSASQVARGKALRDMERGEGANRTYEHLLPEWRLIARSINNPDVTRIVGECIAAIGDELVPEKQRGTMVGLLKKICHRFGRPLFEQRAKVKYTNLDKRVVSGNLGTFKDNFDAVVAMLRLMEEEERLASTAEQPAETEVQEKPLAEYWDHPWVTEFRTVWMAETGKQLGTDKMRDGKRVLLCERLKMLAAFAGGHQHEASLRTTFKIPAQIARELAGNNVIDRAHVETILSTLKDKQVVPAAAADAFLDEWDAGVSETAAVVEAPLGTRLTGALEKKNMDYHGIALALDIRGRRPDEASPVSLVRDSVGETRVNDAVSMYSVSALARATVAEVDADTRRFMAELRARPKVNGRQFTSAWSFMTQFALRNSDLPSPHDKAEIEQYSTAHTGSSNQPLIGAILQTGWHRATEAVERWNALHEPTTVRNAATDLHAKVGGRAFLENVKVSAKDTLPRIQAGTEVPTLAILRQMVTDGQAITGNALLQDWYIRRAELANGSAPTQTARALDVYSAANANSITALIDGNATTVTGAGSADTVRKMALRLTRGEAVTDGSFENVLRMCKIADAKNPTGLFFRSLRVATLPQALNEYGRRLAEAGCMDVIDLLLRAKLEATALVQPPKTEQPSPLTRLQNAMTRKEGILARRAGGAAEPQGALLQLLQFAPGLLPAELVAWTPEMATATVATATLTQTPDPVPSVVAKKTATVTAPVVRETVVNPDEALYEQLTGALYERVPAEYRQFWDNLAAQCNLRGMFDYQTKKRNNRDAATLEKLMWSALSIAINRTERR